MDGEKVARIKVRLEDRSAGAFQRFELIEVLSLGIEGKRALWTSLMAAAQHVPALQGEDYSRLIERADHQRQIAEAHRLEAAAQALAPERESISQP